MKSKIIWTKGIFFTIIFLMSCLQLTFAQVQHPNEIKTGTDHGKIGPLRDFKKIENLEEFHKQRALQKMNFELDGIERNVEMKEKLYPAGHDALPQPPDPLLQGAEKSLTIAPNVTQSWAGTDAYSDPSDCNGAIGPNHYMQTINVSYTVFNRSGAIQAGPSNMNNLFSGVTGATCNDGDPIILYDEQADRWLAAEFSLCGATDRMLIAVSDSPDPTGTWHRWSFDVDDMPDYAKFGIWRDGYYMSTNLTGGNDVYVFERSVMIAGGASPQMVGFDNAQRPNSGFHCIMPLDNDGSFAPNGTPGQFITINDNVWGYSDALWIYELDVNWSSPGSSTFGRVQTLSVSSFDSDFGLNWDNISQSGTAQKLDAINTVLMYRAQYMNFGSYQTIVCQHTVDVDGTNHAGIRWYELRSTGGTWSIRQSGTYAPDARSRWCGGISMNKKNEIGLAYSISGTTEKPGIRFTGQTTAEYSNASGVFDIDETIVITGTSVQTSSNRWGDYSGMSLDPADSTTFWYTTQYVKPSNVKGTRVVAFNFPDLGQPPYPDFSGTPLAIAQGGTVDFTDLSTNLPTSWSWSFPGGTPSSSTAQHPTGIVYYTTGQYDVTLTATNGNGSSPITKTNYVEVLDQGCGAIIYEENFEGVTAPALPVGMTTTTNTAPGFYTGNAADANAGGWWPVPAHGIFAMTNDDLCGDPCDRSVDYLFLPTLNFTSETGMILSFAYYDDGQYSQAPSTVELNINGAGWNVIWTASPLAAWQIGTVTLTGTDNTPNIQIRFHYNDAGQWATGLAVDDISVGKAHSNNNVLTSTSNFTYYTSIPYLQTSAFSMSGNILNSGFNNQTGTHLNVNITGSQTFNGNSPSSTLNVGIESPFTVSTTFTPNNIGYYNVVFSAVQDSTDCTPLDNIKTLADAFYVSDTVYSRDDEIASMQLSSTSYSQTNLNYKAALKYVINATDNVKSITLGVGPAAVVGTSVRGRIWNDATGPNTIVASTDPYIITAEDQYSDLTLPITGTPALTPGTYYVGFESDTNFFILAGSYAVEAGSLWLEDGAATWYSDADGVAETYFIRLNSAFNPPPNDLALEGIGFTEYSQIPLAQVEPIPFIGVLGNNGDNNQTNVEFKVTITGSGSFIDSSATIATLLPTIDSVVTTANTYDPSVGNYDVLLEALSDQSAIDNAPFDNYMTARFAVTDTVYARDNGVYTGSGRYNVGISYELGNAFEVINPRKATSISTYLHSFTDAGTLIKAVLYEGDLSTVVDQSSNYTIQVGDINSGFITIPLPNEPGLVPGWYYACIVQINNGDTVVIADGSDFIQGTANSVFRDTAVTGTWYSLDDAPFIRLNFSNCPALLVNVGSMICSSDTVELVASEYWDYTWSPSGSLSASTGDIVYASPSVNTTYTVVGTAGSCSDSTTVSVNIPPTNVMSGIDETAPSACDGSGTATPSGGTSPYTYAWDVIAAGTANFPGATGTYNETATTDFTATVSGIGTVLNGTTLSLTIVCVNITQFRAADLDLYLISPDATMVALTLDNGGTASNHYTNTCFDMSAGTAITAGSAPFTGSYIPQEDLNLFNNSQNPNGVWTLRVTEDNGAGAGGNGVNSWSLNFDYISSITTATATDLCNGTYNVTVTDAEGCSLTDQVTLPFAVAPVADFTSDVTTVCEGGTVTYNDNSTGSPTAWLWTFENGTPPTSTLQNPTVTYSNTGIYDVTLYAENGTGNDTKLVTNYVTVNANLPVSISIVESQNNICAGTNVTFTATPTNGGGTPSYQWKVNGGNVGTNSPNYSSTALANGDAVTCVLTSSEICKIGSPATSNSVSMTVNPNLPVSVSIAADANPVCTGTNVTFTATPTNGGGTPAYQWKVNGGNVGTDSPTYANTSLANGDVVTCVLTSSLTCKTGSPATSNAVNMTVTANAAVSVSIAASANPTCVGSNVTFTATPTNGGGTPAYQWKVNGSNVGTNSPTYVTSSLSDGDVVTCVLTSSLTCQSGGPATSNTVNMTINPNLPVSVSIAESQNNICAGTSVTFTATPTSGGGTPAYQWKVNGTNVGTNSATYASSSLANNANVTCVLTSSETCQTGGPATSNTVFMVVNPNLAVSVAIAADANPVCAGTNVTFTATPTNGGGTPSYQWKVNGGNVGTDSPNYASSSLINGNTVTCVLTSSATCPTGNPATSSTVTMTVNPVAPVSLAISANNNPICNGSSVTFTAVPANGGATPVYQWKINGGNVGTNSSIYASSSLGNGDAVTCELTSSAACATGNPATSNTVNMTVNAILPASISIVADANPICSGTNVTFTATQVNGGGTPAYQWKLNGSNIGGNSSTYSTSSLANGNTVSCVLTSSETCVSGSPATSNTVSMTVNTAPAITVNPTNKTIGDGGSTTFSVTATGTALTYQWQVDDGSGFVNVINDITYSGATSGTLSLTGVILAMDGYLYQCIVSGTCAPNATSTTATLNVNSAPAITVQPVDKAICNGSSTFFSLTAVGAGLTYQWQVDNGGGFVNIVDDATYSGAQTAFLDVSNPGAGMNGYLYQCIVTGLAPPDATSDIATLTIEEAPAVTTDPITSSICDGDNTSFAVTATGAGLTYQWQVDDGGGFVNITDDATYSGATTDLFDITAAGTGLSGYLYQCVISGNCTPSATSASVGLTVNSIMNVSVSVVADASTVCSGTAVTFTATPTNGGSTPSYDWLVNGLSVGAADSDVFTTSSLNNGDNVSVELTSDIASCAAGNPALSNAIVVTVNPSVPVSASIVEDVNGICSGATVTFTATPTNEGGSPSYDWTINGISAGAPDNAVFTSNSLANSDNVAVILTSSVTCASGNPATSNTVTMTISTTAAADVSITTPPGVNCQSSDVTFTASPVNGGVTPAYIWYVNGIDVGAADNSDFTSSTLADGDNVSCIMMSSESCASNNPATSNSVAVIITPITAVSVSILADAIDICSGDTLNFAATPVGEGITPAYTWLINGVDAGAADADVFSSSALANGDVVSCELVSSEVCPSALPAVSNNVNVVVNQSPVVDLGADQAICLGDTLILDAQNIGSSYFWSTGLFTQTIEVASAGTYSVDVTNTSNCSFIDEITITLNTPGNSGIGDSVTACIFTAAFDLDTVLSGTPDAGGVWTDAFGTVISNLFDPATQSSGIYTYTVSGSAPCADVSTDIIVTVDVCPGNEEIESETSATLYPNPTDGILNVKVSGHSSPVYIAVTDVDGRTIQTGIIEKGTKGDVTKIDFSKRSKGVYLIKLSNDKTNLVKKVVYK